MTPRNSSGSEDVPIVSDWEKFETDRAFKERELAAKEKEAMTRCREVDLKDREVSAKESEVKARGAEVDIRTKEFARSRLNNPLAGAIFLAASAVIGNTVVAYMGARATLVSFDKKAESDLLVEVIKDFDEQRIARKIEYLSRLGAINNPRLVQGIREVTTFTFANSGGNTVPATPPICKDGFSRTFSLQNTPTLDGEGNTVGIIGPMSVTIFKQCIDGKPGPSRYSSSYRYYNGSGTQKGNQYVSLTFRAADGTILPTVPPATFQLDRSRCVYGGSEARTAEGALSLDGQQVDSVSLDVSRVTGEQGRC